MTINVFVYPLINFVSCISINLKNSVKNSPCVTIYINERLKRLQNLIQKKNFFTSDLRLSLYVGQVIFLLMFFACKGMQNIKFIKIYYISDLYAVF